MMGMWLDMRIGNGSKVSRNKTKHLSFFFVRIGRKKITRFGALKNVYNVSDVNMIFDY